MRITKRVVSIFGLALAVFFASALVINCPALLAQKGEGKAKAEQKEKTTKSEKMKSDDEKMERAGRAADEKKEKRVKKEKTDKAEKRRIAIENKYIKRMAQIARIEELATKANDEETLKAVPKMREMAGKQREKGLKKLEGEKEKGDEEEREAEEKEAGE